MDVNVLFIPCAELQARNLRIATIAHPKANIPIACLQDAIDGTFFELQTSQLNKYGSWFLHQRISSSPTFYIATRLDITYFIIPSLRKQSDNFRPIDQIAIDTVLTKSSTRELLVRICDVKTLDDDLMFYRFSQDKTLSWLKRRVEATAAVIARQRSRNNCDASIHGQGFTLLTASSPTTTSSQLLTATIQDTVKAYQIISDYLEEDMATSLRTFLEIVPSVETSKPKVVKRQTDWEKDVEVASTLTSTTDFTNFITV
jgi:hypothetical protein